MAIPVPKLSVDQYLALDRAAEVKSEYHDGQIFPVEAVSWQHSRIAVKTVSAIDAALSGSPCQLVLPIRVRVSPTKFVYPDMAIVCGRPDFTDEEVDTITNPKVIIEILSPSTADYNYGGKFSLYRQLSSFEEYVLIAQSKMSVEVIRRQPDGRWLITPCEGENKAFAIETLNIRIPLSAIYAGVELKSEAE